MKYTVIISIGVEASDDVANVIILLVAMVTLNGLRSPLLFSSLLYPLQSPFDFFKQVLSGLNSLLEVTVIQVLLSYLADILEDTTLRLEFKL